MRVTWKRRERASEAALKGERERERETATATVAAAVPLQLQLVSLSVDDDDGADVDRFCCLGRPRRPSPPARAIARSLTTEAEKAKRGKEGRRERRRISSLRKEEDGGAEGETKEQVPISPTFAAFPRSHSAAREGGRNGRTRTEDVSECGVLRTSE